MQGSHYTDVEVIFLAAGVFVERLKTSLGEAVSTLAAEAVRVGQPVVEVARRVVVAAGTDTSSYDHEVAADHPRLIRPTRVAALDPIGVEMVHLAIGVMAERYGEDFDEAARMVKFRAQVGDLAAVENAWHIVEGAANAHAVPTARDHIGGAWRTSHAPTKVRGQGNGHSPAR